MVRFLRRYRGHHIWLLCLLVFFALYFALRGDKALMNALCGKVLLPAEQWVGQVCSHVPVSVAEVLIVLLIAAALAYVVVMLWRLVRRGEKKATAYCLVMTLLLGVATLYAGFCLLWGTFYQTDSFQDKSGLTARGGTVEELQEVTAYFAAQAAHYAPLVKRGADGSYNVARDDILAGAPAAYDGAVNEFPFLAKDDQTPKRVTFSRVLSMMNFTGFYSPFTGEANLNVDSPAFYLPATLCHEMAHQRGIASEQECNFVGILAAVTADDAAYNYSGWLMGYVYLHNALYRVDQDACLAIRATLGAEADGDLKAHSAYWAQFEGPVKEASQSVYDGFLKSNGEADGIQSYGTVADLLLAYYLPKINQ